MAVDRIQTSPLPQHNSAPGAGGSVHTVQRGDNLSNIAARNGVSLEALKAANPQIKNASLIFPGDKINIPSGGQAATYTVQRGDTLGTIAARNGTTISALDAANPQIRNLNRIYPGDTIQLPTGARAGGGTGPAAPAPSNAAAVTAGGSSGVGTTGSVAGLRPDAASVRAAEYAESHVLARSTGKCYRYVKLALQATGAANSYLVGVAAKEAGPALRAQGFVNVLGRPGANIRSPYDAPPGAVLVYGASSSAVDKNARYGHIEFRTQNGFASDYFSPNARTGPASNGLSSAAGDTKGRVLIGVYIRPAAGGAAQAAPTQPTTQAAPTTQASTATGGGGRVLGSVSEVYESGRRGPGTVSTGTNDPGGVSYGVYQLSSNKGTLQSFMRNEGARWAGEFGDARPGSQQFSTIWRRVAAENPAQFRAAQHQFIERTHYDKAVNGITGSTSLDLNSRHQAVREATWSVSVQHGGAQTILARAIRATDAQLSRTDAGYDRQLVENIYSERTRYVLSVANQSDKTPGERQQLIDITNNRYPAELRDVRRLF